MAKAQYQSMQDWYCALAMTNTEEVPQRLQPDELEAVGVHAGLVLRLGHDEDGGVALRDVGLQDVPQLLLEVVVDDGELRSGGAVVGDADPFFEATARVLVKVLAGVNAGVHVLDEVVGGLY